jgi:phospholipid-binding lipoprotein MlaA
MNSLVKRSLLIIGFALLLPACATTSNPDPLEGINRGIYKFNEVADDYVIKPVAVTYTKVAPSPIRKGVNNFFNNIQTLTTVLNDLLQLKFTHAFTDAGRFVINSTFGLAGLIDVASMDNIERRVEDFGQTLGYWGVGNGPYILLPILGPSTLRDSAGLAFDTYTSDAIYAVHQAGNVKTSNILRGSQIIDKRVILLDATDIADSASLDPYAFTRDGYIQRRQGLVDDSFTKASLQEEEFEPADEDVVPDTAATQK